MEVARIEDRDRQENKDHRDYRMMVQEMTGRCLGHI